MWRMMHLPRLGCCCALSPPDFQRTTLEICDRSVLCISALNCYAVMLVVATLHFTLSADCENQCHMCAPSKCGQVCIPLAVLAEIFLLTALLEESFPHILRDAQLAEC